MWRLRIGRDGEGRVAKHLRRAGCRILDRNWRCSRGELDLVALDEDTVAFVEVRTRDAEGLADPLETVDRGKRRRVIAAARDWVTAHPERAHEAMRFDVVAVRHGALGRAGVEIEWVKDAFDVEGDVY